MSDYVNAAATPRTIPWDCSDWQAAAAVDDAENARVSSILESLAANRGKTLYCAVDQSDTFTKAETWEAGKDRNERDDTVYQGQNGRFRGFLAAQEGYLTDGESGVTGISRDRVFEFPEEPRRGKKRVIKRKELPEATIYSDWGHLFGAISSQGAPDSEVRSGATRGGYGEARRGFYRFNAPGRAGGAHLPAHFEGKSRTEAEQRCDALGYPRVGRIAITDPGPATGGGNQGHWDYRDEMPPAGYRYTARQFRLYTAVCEKTVRVRRR